MVLGIIYHAQELQCRKSQPPQECPEKKLDSLDEQLVITDTRLLLSKEIWRRHSRTGVDSVGQLGQELRPVWRAVAWDRYWLVCVHIEPATAASLKDILLRAGRYSKVWYQGCGIYALDDKPRRGSVLAAWRATRRYCWGTMDSTSDGKERKKN